MTETHPPRTAPGPAAAARRAWTEFRQATAAARFFVATCTVAAVVLPVALRGVGSEAARSPGVTALVLVLVSALNVELGRVLAGGLSRSQQPHKALSAWAFACALLLPTPLLLVVVPVTYAHTRWRGLRVPLWKWIGSACFVVLAGLAAAVVRHALLPGRPNWMLGDGGRGLAVMVLAGAAFLLVEALLFAGPAWLNHAEDEMWLRRTLRSRSYYGTESAVLLIGGLLSAVWTGGPWYVLLFLPIYALAQRAALHEPLRERADTADELASKNDQLEQANQFKADLMGMLGHEIGNPLTAITGYSQLAAEALDGAQDDAAGSVDVAAARASLAVVERSAAQIKTVLHEVLSMVSSEGATLTARQEPCPVEDHCRDAAAAQPHERRPVVECEPGLAALVQPGHLDQILVNLLSNAEKYAGGATRITARSTGSGDVQLAVRDEGPGIPAAFRGQLFQRFSRHAGTAGHVAGTGLGLFISRELARANGGDLEHRDGRPRGSVFVVTLPAVRASDVPA